MAGLAGVFLIASVEAVSGLSAVIPGISQIIPEPLLSRPYAFILIQGLVLTVLVWGQANVRSATPRWPYVVWGGLLIAATVRLGGDLDAVVRGVWPFVVCALLIQRSVVMLGPADRVEERHTG